MRAVETRLAPVCLHFCLMAASALSLSSSATAQSVDYSVTVTNLENDLSSLITGPAFDTAAMVGGVLARTRSTSQAIEMVRSHLGWTYGSAFLDLGTSAQYRAAYDERTRTVQIVFVETGSFRLFLSEQSLDVRVSETTSVTDLSRAVAPPPVGARVHFMTSVVGQENAPQALESASVAALVDTLMGVLDDLPSGDLWIERSQVALGFPEGPMGIVYKLVKDPVTGLPVPRCCEELMFQLPSDDGLLQVKIAEDTSPLEE